MLNYYFYITHGTDPFPGKFLCHLFAFDVSFLRNFTLCLKNWEKYVKMQKKYISMPKTMYFLQARLM